MTRILSGLLLSLLIYSCIPEGEAISESGNQKSDVYIELLSEIKTFERSYGNCFNDTTGSCTTISISYPYFSGTLNPQAENVINNKITSMLVDNMMYDSVRFAGYEEFASAFIADYQEVKNEFGEAFGWQYEGNVGVLRSDSIHLTLKFENYLYTGGAHGMYVVRYLNINPETGVTYQMNDLFVDNYTGRLNEFIKKAFLKKLGLSTGEDLSNAGYWFEDEQYYNENLAILEDTVLFYYNQYEIAPYAMGPTRLAIPLQVVDDVLKPRFRLKQ